MANKKKESKKENKFASIIKTVLFKYNIATAVLALLTAVCYAIVIL